jgi:hypothetical protein
VTRLICDCLTDIHKEIAKKYSKLGHDPFCYQINVHSIVQHETAIYEKSLINL